MSCMKLILSFTLISFVTACAQPITKTDAGLATGAVVGAIAGSTVGDGRGKTLATLGGSLLGAYVGTQIGQQLQKSDVDEANKITQQALEFNRINQRADWVNPDTRNQGTVTPTRTIKTADGTFCREFTQTVTIGGTEQQAFGEACRAPDGTWRIRQQ